MDAVLQFDDVAHRYTLDGRELISVTTALGDAGLIDRQWFNDGAAERGTKVHAAVQAFHATGDLPEDETAAFFDAYLAFQMDAGFDVEASEERVCDPLLGYAGTLDLRGRFRAQVAGVDLIDIKTGTVPPHVGYQTAAYARLVTGPVRRWALHLKANGRYQLVPQVKRTDERVFLAALLVAQAKRGWL